ncbi:MAG: alpha-amylase, partial [Flavobacterium johnsoniae]
MKKITLLFLLIASYAWSQQQTVTYSVTPATFEENQSITLTFNGSSINEATWGVAGNALYIWAWSFDLNDQNNADCPTNGDWGNSNEANRLTYNSANDTYSISFVPTAFYNRTGIGRIGFLIKAKNGNGDKKSQDILLRVGTFQVNLTAPVQNSSTMLASGSNFTITANNTGGNASYVLKSNGSTINTNASTASYSYTHTGITSNQNYSLEVTQGATTITKNFAVVINPGVISEAMPAGMGDGINYNPSDPTKVTLVLNVPNKDFVYVAGSFNNWQPTGAYAMKKDPATGKFWLELSGLTSGTAYTYQYWVCDQTNLPANSPALVKTADPFSTLVLSPYDDPEIASLGVYPNLPAYPAGQEREVTVLQTGPNAFYNYNWSAATTNFVKPSKKDLVIYEVLVRDFDANRTYQNLIDRIDYFKNLKINAIQLMPVMEFEGNESWGYNTVYHLALDKRYGTEAKLKEFIDSCHSKQIAVIMDVVPNHVYNQSPLAQLYWDAGQNRPAANNPWLNPVQPHAFGFGNDFNHESAATKYFWTRMFDFWMREYKMDGFRMDFTKGLTQKASTDDGQFSAYDQSRVDILRSYGDTIWKNFPSAYIILEHLAAANEEQTLQNLGFLLWSGKGPNVAFNEATMGYH